MLQIKWLDRVIFAAAVCAFMVSAASAGTGDYGLSIDRIQYSDANGIAVDFDFVTPPANPAPTHYEIPSSAVTLPPPYWSESTFLWSWEQTPDNPFETELTGDSYRMSIPQPTSVNHDHYGRSSLGAFAPKGAPPAASNQWSFEVRLKDFANVTQSLVPYEFGVGTGGFGNITGVDASGIWYSGLFQGIVYDQVLSLSVSVNVRENDIEIYDWSSAPSGPGLLVFGLDPTTAQIDLKVVVNDGYDLAGFYRINSDTELDWKEIASHTLPGTFPPATGFAEQFPYVWINDSKYCPGDCGDKDGNVGIVDFLALLAEWGQVGTSCDIDGGGVGIVDFLALLANWGPCP